MKHGQRETYSYLQRRLKRAVRVLILKVFKSLKEVAE